MGKIESKNSLSIKNHSQSGGFRLTKAAQIRI